MSSKYKIYNLLTAYVVFITYGNVREL